MSDSRPPCTRQEKNPPQKGSELPGFSLQPNSGSKMQSPQAFPYGSYQPFISKRADECYKNHKATMYSRHPTHPNSAVCLSGMSFQNLFCVGGRGRALTLAGTSLLPHEDIPLLPLQHSSHHGHAILCIATSLLSPCICPMVTAKHNIPYAVS